MILQFQSKWLLWTNGQDRPQALTLSKSQAFSSHRQKVTVEYKMSNVSQDQHDLDVVTKQRQELRRPSLYKVLLHNDNYTSMDFVVVVLEQVFNRQSAAAHRIMMNVHKEGVGVAGVYPRDVAETKTAMVHSLANKHEYPLKCSLERE